MKYSRGKDTCNNLTVHISGYQTGRRDARFLGVPVCFESFFFVPFMKPVAVRTSRTGMNAIASEIFFDTYNNYTTYAMFAVRCARKNDAK